MNISNPESKATAKALAIAGFDLCHCIGLEIEQIGRSVSAYGVHFPATVNQVRSALERVKSFADRARIAVDSAHADWEKHHGR